MQHTTTLSTNEISDTLPEVKYRNVACVVYTSCDLCGKGSTNHGILTIKGLYFLTYPWLHRENTRYRSYYC